MAGDLSNEVELVSEQFQKIREKIGLEKFNAFAARYVRLDPGKYVSHAAPAVVFMQFATQENFLTPERVRKYAELVSEPKKFKLYDAPHALCAEARRDRIVFLTDQLKLSLLSPELIDTIPDLPQPPMPKQ